MLLRRVFLPLKFVRFSKTTASCSKSTMDFMKQLQSFAWCKPDWCFPSMGKEADELLKQCADITTPELSDDIDELIAKSKAFPIPFPIQSVRLEELKDRRPIDKLRKNISSTYPLIHERVLLLMTHFLLYKREFGSAIEKEFYKDMTVPGLIDRILKKRAISFAGPKDSYMLISGEEGQDGWESVGTVNQKPPLTLDNCLSYDEMKISSMVFVSGHTTCINDGRRTNEGVIHEKEIETEAVIIGTIGPRFERKMRMDYEDILVTEEQNCPDNGYGEEVTPTTCLNVLRTTYVRNNQSTKHMWRQLWSEFYQVPSYTYGELTSYVSNTIKDEQKSYTDRYVPGNCNTEYIFDNEVYYKRICILTESVLVEANARGRGEGRHAFVNVIGCGLGVWKVSNHQNDVYVLTMLERIRHMLRKDMLNHVSDVNFAYIKTSDSVTAMLTGTSDKSNKTDEKRIFFESKRHPRGGINVQFENREPSAKLCGAHSDKLLVLTYPWDSNAHPGNVFWFGNLSTSGDPAAACSTQVSELHNAHINQHVSSGFTRVTCNNGLKTIQEYCQSAGT